MRYGGILSLFASFGDVSADVVVTAGAARFMSVVVSVGVLCAVGALANDGKG